MKLNFNTLLLTGAAASLLTEAAVAQGPRPDPPAAPSGVYTNVSGSITQLNYNRDAIPEGLLLNDKTLVHFPPNAASTSLVKPDDNVDIEGMAVTNASGVRTIEVQQLHDRTNGKTFSVPQPGQAAPYSGSGHIQQLNYGPDGAVNGFMLDNGTLVTLPPFSATNPSSIRPGASVSFTGFARTSVTGRTVVDLQSISLEGRTLYLVPGGAGRGVDVPPPPEAPVAAAQRAPDGRLEQTPPPPPRVADRH